jgi:hypothetical protein
MVGTKGYVTDLPKVVRCDAAIIDVNADYVGNKFILKAQPITAGNIVKNRYFTAIWERVV